MKIGILTLPLRTNYGGILQAFALQTVLERLGHNASVIKYYPDNLTPLQTSIIRCVVSYPVRFFKKYILGKKIIIQFEKHINESRRIATKYTHVFIKGYLKLYGANDFSSIKKEDFEAIVVGSDQIWRKPYFAYEGRDISDAYLKFAKDWNILRVAYAASFGCDNIDEYTQEEKNQCKQLINLFDNVSVRESSGINICADSYNINALQVLDPTLLLDKSDYMQLIHKYEGSLPQGDLFYYILDRTSNVLQGVFKIAEAKNYSMLSVNAKPEFEDVPINERIQRPVEEWLNGILCSKMVITDSFHACVFSIIFNRPFWVYVNKKRGIARIETLLNLLNLENRIVYNHNEIDDNIQIDWGNVNERLQSMRMSSFNYLKNSL